VWRRAFLAAASTALLAIVSACATLPPTPTSEVAVAEDTVAASPSAPALVHTPSPLNLGGEGVLIAQVGNMTGRGSEFTLPMLRGVQDAVRKANEEDGLYGAQLILETYNTGGNGRVAGEILAHLRENARPAAVIFLDADLADDLRTELNSLNVPILLPWASLGNLAADEQNYLFGLTPPADVELAFLMRFLAENWETYRPAQAGPDIKLAVIEWPNVFGQAALVEGARGYLDNLGVRLVYEGTLNASYAEDAIPALRQAMRAEANVLYVQGYAYGPAVLLNDYHWLGLQDQALVAGPSWALDIPTYGYLTKPDYLDGFLAPSGLAWWSDSANPGIATLLADLQDSERTPADQSLGRLIGFEAVGILFQAVRASLENAGGLDFSGADLRQAIVSMEDATILNGLATVSFSGDYQFPPYLRVRQANGFGVFEEIGGYSAFLEYP
jgi:ABC-type branched-subunit amino acid transport system substrate-binding protein